METEQETPWFRELYDPLLGYDGRDCYTDLLLPWLPQAKLAVTHLTRFREFFLPTDGGDEFLSGLWNLYALSRVNDFLLLPFQGGWDGPHVTPEQYAGYFEAMGLLPFRAAEFSAFRHEIVGVTESEDADDPPEVVECLWPGLMLGNLLVSRSGVRVRAGGRHVTPVAERSTLYFTHRRLARRTEDLSAGWGSNSQWRTRFRRDYDHSGHFLYNVDGTVDLTSDSQFDHDRDGLTTRERIEQCRHRCFVVTEKPDADLWTYDYRHREWQDGPTAFDPRWLTRNDGLVRRLADPIRADRAFDRLPILADALEDAGCQNRVLLDHCRETGRHGPRCWAVEYLLDG